MYTLRELRLKSFLTQEELAKKANISRYTVTRLESGKMKPSISSARALAKALKVKPGDISFKLL